VFRLAPASVPGAPTIGTATAGDGQATVSFAAPSNTGQQPITGYTVTAAPGGATAHCAASPCTVTGLTNGTAYTFTVTATNGVGTGAASASSNSVTPTAQVDGACGAAQGVASLLAPAANLCSAGQAGAVSNASPWNWVCAGTGGGNSALCTAPNAATSTGSGAGRLALTASSGVTAWQVQSASFTAVTTTGTSGPPGVSFPHGLLALNLNQGSPSSAATVTVTYPSALPAGATYWKYGKTRANTSPHWYVYPGASFSGNTVTLTLTDGGDGDDDLTANSVIVDPGGVGQPAAAEAVLAVPALGGVGQCLLGLMMLCAAWVGVRRRQG